MDFTKSLLCVVKDGTIENDGDGLLQVDFANRFIGGGVLGGGCVSEEIRFVICPELLCSRLFTECLADNEAVTIMGCERFNDYTGYSFSFEWTGNYKDETPMDSFRRRKCTVVAIDAMPFSIGADQFRENMLNRELNKVRSECSSLGANKMLRNNCSLFKAYVGFKHDLSTQAPGVATGNWGCGAFNGNKQLKSLLQLMACVVADRPLVYFTFGSEKFCDELTTFHKFLLENRITIGNK